MIWQMGKVGSSSLLESLEDACPERPVTQVHILKPELRVLGEAHARAALRWRSHQEWNQALYECILHGLRGPKVVTLVREPVARNVSAFFQNLDVYLSPVEMAALASGRIDEEFMHQAFVGRFPHDRPQVWFEYEMAGLLGVDVFAAGFNKELGYQSYDAGQLDLMVVKLERMDQALPAIGGFLGSTSPIRQRRSNVRDEQAFGEAYKSFKSSFEMPANLLGFYRGLKYSHTFYRPDEIGRSFKQAALKP